MAPGEGGDSAVRLLGAADIRALAARLHVEPTKKLGQNFVIDANTVRRIVSVAGVRPGDTVLEVGPGLGSLTMGLLDAGAQVVAVEIDRRLAEELPVTALARGAAPGSLAVLSVDALAMTRTTFESRRGARRADADSSFALVANLPYNVSVPVVLHLLETFPNLTSGLVMVQAEVGERIAAAPGSRTYGVPSVKSAWYGTMSLAGRVARAVFWPVPNVDSVLVRFERHAQPGTEEERQRVFALVDAAFGQRRKMLRQSLRELLGPDAEEKISAADVDPRARGEQLSVGDFLAIARMAVR